MIVSSSVYMSVCCPVKNSDITRALVRQGQKVRGRWFYVGKETLQNMLGRSGACHLERRTITVCCRLPRINLAPRIERERHSPHVL